MPKHTTKKEVRAALKKLDEILARNDHGAERLWDIITALRGPDDDVGKNGTVKVRRETFPLTVKKMEEIGGWGMSGAMFVPSSVEDDESRRNGHFRLHLARASSALAELNGESEWEYND